MNLFDLILLGLLAIFGLLGALWGVVRILAAFAGFVVALVLGLRFSDHGPAWFGAWIERPEWARLVAFLVVFLGAMIAAALASLFLRRFLKAIHLRWADRLAGAAVGAAAAVLAGVALMVPLAALPPSETPVLEDSVLAPYALEAASWLRGLLPDDLGERMKERQEALRRAWRERDERGDSRDP